MSLSEQISEMKRFIRGPDLDIIFKRVSDQYTPKMFVPNYLNVFIFGPKYFIIIRNIIFSLACDVL